jgi:hypothetical protein
MSRNSTLQCLRYVNYVILLYGLHLFWRMTQSDWLLTGQDLPVLPTGKRIFNYPVRKTITRTWKLNEILFIKVQSVKMRDQGHCESGFYYTQSELENQGHDVCCPFNEVQYLIICFIRVCRLSSIRNAHMPYNKKPTDFDCIFLYSPHYHGPYWLVLLNYSKILVIWYFCLCWTLKIDNSDVFFHSST